MTILFAFYHRLILSERQQTEFVYTKMDLGEQLMNRLKELREDNDLLQKEVAEKLGITQRNYSYLETEQTTLTEDILVKLALFYDTSIDYILFITLITF